MTLMLIDEEIRRKWGSILESFRDAEKLEKQGKFREAEDKAIFAVLACFDPIKKLSEELKDPALADIALIVLDDSVKRRVAIDRGEQHPTTTETLEWAFKSLRRLYEAVPLGMLEEPVK